jgi:hypothetical protein
MEKAWVHSIRDQCQAAGVMFFFKQWGGVRKSKTGRELDGRTYESMPSRVAFPVMEHSRRLAAIAEIVTRFVPQPTTEHPDLFTNQRHPLLLNERQDISAFQP